MPPPGLGMWTSGRTRGTLCARVGSTMDGNRDPQIPQGREDVCKVPPLRNTSSLLSSPLVFVVSVCSWRIRKQGLEAGCESQHVGEGERTTMMAYVGCQLGHIWNQLNPEDLGITVNTSLIGSSELRRLPLVWVTLSSAYINEQGRRKHLLFSLLVLTLTGKFIYPATEAVICWYKNSLVQDSRVY